MRLKSKLLSSVLALFMIISTVPVFAAGDADNTTAAENSNVTLADNNSEPRQMEYLNRGGFAATNPTRYGGGIYLSWRLLGTEPMDTVFNIYKNGDLLIANVDNTSYNDKNGTTDDQYTVASVINGTVGKQSEVFPMLNGNLDGSWTGSPYAYFDIPLNIPTAPPGSNYSYALDTQNASDIDKNPAGPNDASVGDVDGDGEYEIILKWNPGNAKDNSNTGITGNVYIDCYEFDGTQLWRIDLGRNIRAGAHYTQFQVYDYDGDGKAEVAMKTAPGSIDGKGNYVSAVGNTSTIRNTDNNANYVGSDGRIVTGPEYLTIFNGETGAAMQTIDYEPSRGKYSDWGDKNYANRMDRFLAGTAYLDGIRPSLIMCRGYYARSVVVAYNWDGKNLTQQWQLDSSASGNSDFAGQGNHQLSVADLDNDGKDEIVYGGAAIDDNGSLMWSMKWTGDYNGTTYTNLKLGHGDALHVSDFDNDGNQEIFKVNEDDPAKKNGVWGRAYIETNGTNATLKWLDVATDDDGRGIMANFSPKYGVLAWDSGLNIRKLDGTVVASTLQDIDKITGKGKIAPNFAIFWDGDLYREHLDGDKIHKWLDNETADDDGNLGYFNRIWTLTTKNPVDSNNGTKKTPCLQADLFGDWREEIILRHSDGSALRIFTSLIPTEHKLTTFMHDSQYRCAVAWQNTGYNQPPHQSYYIDEDKTDYVQPNIATRALDPEIKIVVKNSDNTPAAGVNVNLNGIEKPTNSEGIVSYRVANDKEYSYTINQYGYKNITGTVNLASGAEYIEQSVVLEALPESTICVKSGDLPITGASVTIDEQTVSTDENGTAIFKLNAGQYDYTVSCHKFVTKTGTLDISENGSSENIEIEPIDYVYDSTTDTDGSKFTYSGESGAELSFSGGTWTFKQNSTDGGRSFGAAFDTSANGNVEFEMTYGTGGQKDSSDAWNWSGRNYTHEIKLLDKNGSTLIGLSQSYTDSGVQQVQYYTGSKSKTNVSTGTMIGAPNITARSASTWRIKFNIDLKAKTVDFTLTDENGANGYEVTDIPISVTSFSGVTIGSTAAGNVTWAPTLKDVLYYSDCILSDYTVSVGTITGNGELKFVKPVPTPAPVADVANYYPTSSTTFGNDTVIYTDDKLTVTSVFAGSSASSSYTSDFGKGYQLTLRIGNSGDISSHISDVTSTGGEILSNGTTLILDVTKSGTLTTYVGAAGGNRTIHLWDNTADADAKDARTLDASSVIKSTFEVVAGHQYILYTRGFTGSFIGLSLEAYQEPSTDDEILVDELIAYSGDTIKVKAITEEEKTAITTNPEVEVTDIGNGYYTFIMPEADTTVNAEFKSTSAYPYTINSVQKSVDGISVNLTKNSDTDPETNTVIVAAYDSDTGILKNINFKDVTLSVDASDDINVELEYSDSDLVVAYVWGSMSNIAPLSKSKNLN